MQISSLVNHSQPDLAETESPINGTDEIMATDIDTYFKSELIYQRNERMAKRVKTLLDKNPRDSYFFAFGAGEFFFSIFIRGASRFQVPNVLRCLFAIS